jgi:hypothetical protein
MGLSSKVQDIFVERCTGTRRWIGVICLKLVRYTIVVYIAGNVELPDWFTSHIVQDHEQTTPGMVLDHIANHYWGGAHSTWVLNIALLGQCHGIGGVNSGARGSPAVVVVVSSPSTPRTFPVLDWWIR